VPRLAELRELAGGDAPARYEGLLRSLREAMPDNDTVWNHDAEAAPLAMTADGYGGTPPGPVASGPRLVETPAPAPADALVRPAAAANRPPTRTGPAPTTWSGGATLRSSVVNGVRFTVDPRRLSTIDTRTAGTHGIEEIRIEFDANGRQIVTAAGRIRPQIARQHFEKAFPRASTLPALRGYDMDNAHLWPCRFGDECGAGVMHAPRTVNRGRQSVLERQFQDLNKHLGPGQEIILRARVTSFPAHMYGGTAAQSYRYDFAVMQGLVAVDRNGIIFGIDPNPGGDGLTTAVVPGGLIW
jgi:hypothetical protein